MLIVLVNGPEGQGEREMKRDKRLTGSQFLAQHKGWWIPVVPGNAIVDVYEIYRHDNSYKVSGRDSSTNYGAFVFEETLSCGCCNHQLLVIWAKGKRPFRILRRLANEYETNEEK